MVLREVLVRINRGRTYCIEVGLLDTVLNIREKIEKDLGIAVSKQTLFFNGKVLLKDHLNVQKCRIRNKSLLELFVPSCPKPNPINNQVFLHQTEQSSQVPSMSIQDSLEMIFNNQDSTLGNEDQVVHQTEVFPVSNDGFLGSQDWSVMASSNNDGQVLHRTGEFGTSSSQINEFLESQDWSVMGSSSNKDDNVVDQTEGSLMLSDLRSMQEFLELEVLDSPLTTTENISIQDLPGSSNNQVFRTEQSPVPLNSFEDILFGEDRALETEVFPNIQNYWPEKTEQSPVPSNAGKEIINIPDSPVRSNKKPRQMMRVLILPFSREDTAQRKIPVYVNPSENVGELRKVLVKIQGLNLPEEGYFFLSNGNLLDDDQSFPRNRVAQGDTVEIFAGHLTEDTRPDRV
ncbi:unnamed protein product [Arabis nemorensis]|uniref:Ubiquitin-like domain-containing protein n=1 Tax=Arabis nemorensis TaxID=586526 RepID=A0A565C0E2_9BRAS|nr:unnamed protein product [Arabis nemorensis]